MQQSGQIFSRQARGINFGEFHMQQSRIFSHQGPYLLGVSLATKSDFLTASSIPLGSFTRVQKSQIFLRQSPYLCINLVRFSHAEFHIFGEFQQSSKKLACVSNNEMISLFWLIRHSVSVLKDWSALTCILSFFHRFRLTKYFERKIINIFLPISFNIYFGCSKEPSHWDGSFEYPQHIFWLRNNWTLLITIGPVKQKMLAQNCDYFVKLRLFSYPSVIT